MNLKMVLVAYSAGLEPEVSEIVKASGATGFTRWERAAGAGRTSGTHMDSHIWPDFNHVAAVVADAETVSRIMAGVRELRRTEGARGIKAFVLPVEEVTE